MNTSDYLSLTRAAAISTARLAAVAIEADRDGRPRPDGFDDALAASRRGVAQVKARLVRDRLRSLERGGR